MPPTPKSTHLRSAAAVAAFRISWCSGDRLLTVRVPAVQNKGHINHTTRTNQHRGRCGRTFAFRAGEVAATPTAARTYSYVCTHCRTKVTSTTREGQTDNRRGCGHKFTVAAGAVSTDVTVDITITVINDLELPKTRAWRREGGGGWKEAGAEGAGGG